MSYEKSEPLHSKLGSSNDFNDRSEPSSDTIEIASPPTAEPVPLIKAPEINARGPSRPNDASDSESILSRFSDSSSDDGQPSSTQDCDVQPVPPNTEPSFATLSWDELNKIDFGRLDDPDADMNLSAAMRLQEERNRGYLYEKRPKSPFRAHGDEGDEVLYLQSIRYYQGGRLINFDSRHEPITHANGLPSPLRKVRSVDDLSPESPVEDDRNLLVLQAGLTKSSGGGSQDISDTEYDAEDSWDLSPSANNRENGAERDGEGEGDLALPNDFYRLGNKSRPQLQISTDFTDIDKDTAQQLPRQVPAHAEANAQDESLTSAEELEMMTRISPNTSLKMLEEVYEQLKACKFKDATEILKFKRRLIEYQKRGLKYNGLDDGDVKARVYDDDPNSSLAEMFTAISAHFYREQRNEARNQVREEQCKRVEAENLNEEDGWQISMLKHEVEVREGELKEISKALDLKNREAQLWQEAYQQYGEPVAKREFDRKQRLENGEDEIKDVETQTERLEVKSTASQTIRIGSLSSKQLLDKCQELTEQNEDLQLAVEKLEKGSESFRDRNRVLEGRIAESNEAWQTIAADCDADGDGNERVEVWQAKQYITGLQGEVKSLWEENSRLKFLLENVKRWHEEQDAIGNTTPVTASSRMAAPSPATEPFPMPNTPIPPFTGLQKNPRWREREERIRNTETWKRNRDAILRQLDAESEERRRECERRWEEEARSLSPRSPRRNFEV